MRATLLRTGLPPIMDILPPLLPPIDLREDAAARLYLKHEQVRVEFASADGQLMSREGLNRYQAGDALVTGSTGDRWVVSRERFNAKYEAIPPTQFGIDGVYQNKPVPVLAKQIPQAFRLARSAGGDILTGKAGDWVMQYAPGDFGVTEQQRFAAVYRPYQKT